MSNMSNNTTNVLEMISRTRNAIKQNFVSSIVMVFIVLILTLFIYYLWYLSRLEKSECKFINGLYPTIDGNIKSISANNPDCSGNLYDYYIKTAYNACSGGSYKNDYVDICNLKAILNQGVRGLDFEIYSIDNKPVVATSTTNNFYVKETFNSVPFGDVMETIYNYAFSNGTCPNPNDPIIIHLRFMSNNQQMYTNLANIFESYDKVMLGKNYSYENYGQNLGTTPLTSLMGKIVLIVDKTNNAFLENEYILEYVNLTSSSVFMRALNYYDVKNNPDINELTNFNRTGMTICLPDTGINPSNPSAILCRATGCQMVAMRYQHVDNFLEENAIFFDESGYAFALKPANLRYEPVIIPDPTPQNPDYSYAPNKVSTDYYNFNY